MNKKSIFFVSICFIYVILFFMSCGTTSLCSCPYSVSDVQMVVESDESDSDNKRAEVFFVMENNANKNIVSFSVSFRLYDKDGNSVTVDSNSVSTTVNKTLNANDCSDVSFDILPYLSDFPEEAYIVDSFYVKEIRYADGSVWTDPFGIFSEQELFD